MRVEPPVLWDINHEAVWYAFATPEELLVGEALIMKWLENLKSDFNGDYRAMESLHREVRRGMFQMLNDLRKRGQL